MPVLVTLTDKMSQICGYLRQNAKIHRNGSNLLILPILQWLWKIFSF